MLRGDAVEHSRVPVIKDCFKVMQKHDWHVGIGTEVAIRARESITWAVLTA